MSKQQLLNMEVRSKILEYSLVMENSINDLLLFNLGLFGDKEKTKLFSNRGKITFQNKVDLLMDLGILSKEETLEFELLMVIRNKFMHDINCDSFKTLFNQLDNGLVNRFKKFIEEGKSISDEGSCLNACTDLALKNIKTIKIKLEKWRSLDIQKIEFVQAQNEQIGYYIDCIYDLFKDVLKTVEKSELENPKVYALGNDVLQVMRQAEAKITAQSEVFAKNNKIFFSPEANIKSIFGIKGDLKDFSKRNIFSNVEEKNDILKD